MSTREGSMLLGHACQAVHNPPRTLRWEKERDTHGKRDQEITCMEHSREFFCPRVHPVSPNVLLCVFSSHFIVYFLFQFFFLFFFSTFIIFHWREFGSSQGDQREYWHWTQTSVCVRVSLGFYEKPKRRKRKQKTISIESWKIRVERITRVPQTDNRLTDWFLLLCVFAPSSVVGSAPPIKIILSIFGTVCWAFFVPFVLPPIFSTFRLVRSWKLFNTRT